jgi:hypothetical protein
VRRARLAGVCLDLAQPDPLPAVDEIVAQLPKAVPPAQLLPTKSDPTSF